MKITTLTGIAAIAAIAGSASAGGTFTVTGGIEDFGASSGNVLTEVFALPALDSIDSVMIGLAHSWADDIELTLMAPNGDLFVMTDDEGGNNNLGDGESLLSGIASYTFVSPAGNGTWTDVNGDFDNAPIPGGTYDAAVWFAGGYDAGDWTLTLNDDAGGDDGAVGDIKVSYTVPTPGAVALLGLGGLAATRRRR